MVFRRRVWQLLLQHSGFVCVYCHYPLTILPDEGACPECGKLIPPGAPHTFENAGDEPVVMLNTFTPDLYVHYFREVGALFAADRMSPAAGAETRAACWRVRRNGIPEPAASTQAVYHALDASVEAVLTNKNADIQSLLQQANQLAQQAISSGTEQLRRT